MRIKNLPKDKLSFFINSDKRKVTCYISGAKARNYCSDVLENSKISYYDDWVFNHEELWELFPNDKTISATTTCKEEDNFSVTKGQYIAEKKLQNHILKLLHGAIHRYIEKYMHVVASDLYKADNCIHMVVSKNREFILDKTSKKADE